MCLTIIEILFLVSGIWLLISGKIPSKLFQIMFGKGEYSLSPLYTRLFGLLFLLPLFVSFMAGVILGMTGSENSTSIGIGIETGFDILVAIIATVIARKIRKPLSTPPAQTPPSTNQ
jgi:ABC-type transport system involved in multi-copper enzyme maturation permease subunit